MALSRIEARTDVLEEARVQARFAMQAADEGTRETRTISLFLHPPMLEELGLAAAVGVGLGGLTERVEQLRGNLEITSNEAGTCLRVRFPAGQPPGCAYKAGVKASSA